MFRGRLMALLAVASTVTCSPHISRNNQDGTTPPARRVSFHFEGVVDVSNGRIEIRPVSPDGTGTTSQALTELPLAADGGLGSDTVGVAADTGSVISVVDGCLRSPGAGEYRIDSVESDVTLTSSFNVPLDNVIVKFTSVVPPTERDLCNSDATPPDVEPGFGILSYGRLEAAGSVGSAVSRHWIFGRPDATNFRVLGTVMGDIVTANSAPVAVDDAYTVASILNLAGSAANAVLANDSRAHPTATVLSFGGGDVGGDVTTNAAGNTVTLASGGSLRMDADGTVAFTAPLGQAGAFTIDYRLGNSVGTSDATITITLQPGAPVAAADGPYSVDAGGTLTITAADINDLLDNDDLGTPEGTITIFGGGVQAGTSTPFLGGTLTVNADGSFTLDGATTPGAHSFDYEVRNSMGASTATVTVVVRSAPTAHDDVLTVVLGSPLTGNLRADNGAGADERGHPAATVVSFVVDTTSIPAPGASALAGGVLTVSVNGGVTLTGATETGVFTFRYTLQNVVGSSEGDVSITISQPPAAADDTFVVLVNTALNGNVTVENAGAADDLGFPEATATTMATMVAGSPLTFNTDGTFSVTPSTPGEFTFEYTLVNTAGSSVGRVSIRVQQMPVAADDAFMVAVNLPATGTVTLDNGSGADVLGFPAGVVTTTSTTLGGVAFTLNPDGSLALLTYVWGKMTTEAGSVKGVLMAVGVAKLEEETHG